MALTDEEMQDLQSETKEGARLKEGQQISNAGDSSKDYVVVATTNDVTQGIAVAPIVNGEPDYSQTAIVVAGTQPPGDEKGNSLGNEFKSFGRAWLQGEYGYSLQGKDVEELYQKTEKNLEKHGGGEITNMSGHSQAGPAVAKVAANHKVGRVTNFADYGASAAYAFGYITEEDKEYLDKHAYIYSDSKNKTTKLAKGGGAIPYGHVREIEGSNHRTDFARIKGNDLDTDYYVKHHQFCSGMTKEQAREVAEYKAKHDSNPFKDADDYLKEYEKTYGYAKEKTKKSKSKDKNKAKKTSSTALDKKLKDGKGLSLKELLKRYKGAKGSKRRVLRKALLFAGLSAVLAEVGDLAQKVQQLMDESRSEVQDIVEDTRSKAFSFAKELDAGEVESLLSEIDFDRVWSQGAEQANIAQAKAFAGKVESLGSNVMSAGDAIEQADQVASQALASFTQDIISQYN